MRSSPSVLVSSLLLAPALCLAWPGAAEAGEPGVESPETTPLISDGIPAENCQWPTTVFVGGGGGICTGTLIHPEIVVTAAHCPLPAEIEFGESMQQPKRKVATDHCLRNPDYQQNLNNGVNGTDYAYCKLAEPVYDIPFTPPVYGCELEILRPSQPAFIVGFGNNVGDTGAGRKRWVETIIQTQVTEFTDTVVVGTTGAAACSGDSGGPAYVEYPDGSFHAFGIVSGGPPCGAGPDTYSLIHVAAPWIEESSGVDITPCHDIDGTWNPTPACQGFGTDPLNSDVAWIDWCNTERLGPAATCGPAFNSDPDEVPPTVAIVDPVTGTTYDGPQAQFDILIEAMDEGNGIKSVTLEINGDAVAVDEHEPYAFANATFPEGGWLLVAVAEDWNGNVAESEPVAIGVGQDPPSLPGDPSSETGGDTGGTGGMGGTGEAGVDVGVDDPGGCACAAADTGAGGGLGFGLAVLMLVGLRRRQPA